MSKNLHISAVDPQSGKATVMPEISEFLVRNLYKIAFSDAVKMKKAAETSHQKTLDLMPEGPFQYDAVTTIQAKADKGRR